MAGKVRQVRPEQQLSPTQGFYVNLSHFQMAAALWAALKHLPDSCDLPKDERRKATIQWCYMAEEQLSGCALVTFKIYHSNT